MGLDREILAASVMRTPVADARFPDAANRHHLDRNPPGVDTDDAAFNVFGLGTRLYQASVIGTHRDRLSDFPARSGRTGRCGASASVRDDVRGAGEATLRALVQAFRTASRSASDAPHRCANRSLPKDLDNRLDGFLSSKLGIIGAPHRILCSTRVPWAFGIGYKRPCKPTFSDGEFRVVSRCSG